MAYKTLAGVGGLTVANRASALMWLYNQMIAMGWALVDNLGPYLNLYGNLTPSTGITTGTPATLSIVSGGQVTAHGFVTNQKVLFTTSGNVPTGLTPTQSCASAAITNSGGNINVNIAGHGFVDQQPILYSPGGTAAGNLTAGVIYYVKYVGVNDFGLSTTAGGAYIAYSSAGSGTHYFGSIYIIVNPTLTTFQLANVVGGAAINISSQGTGNHSFGSIEINNGWLLFPSHALITTQKVLYLAVPAGGPITGLTTNTAYFVVNPQTDAFQLSASVGGAALALTSQGAGNQVFQFRCEYYGNLVAAAAVNVNPVNTITVPAGHGYVAGQKVIYTTTGTTIGGMTPTQSCTQTGITNAGGLILVTINGHGFVDQQPILFTTIATGGNIPGNLTPGVQYYVHYINANTFGLSLTPGGNQINYSSSGTGTFYFASIYIIVNPQATTIQLTNVNGGSAIALTGQGTGNHSFGSVEKYVGVFLAPNHGFTNGQNPAYVASTTTIPGLTSVSGGGGAPNYGYFIISVQTDSFQLSATQGGAAIAIGGGSGGATPQGVGVHTFNEGYRVYSSAGESADFSSAPNVTHYILIDNHDNYAATGIGFQAYYYWTPSTHAGLGAMTGAYQQSTITTSESGFSLWIYGCATLVAILTKVSGTYYCNYFGFFKKLWTAQSATTQAVASGSNVQVTVADNTQFVLTPGPSPTYKYYQIMGIAGEGRDRIQINALPSGKVQILSLPRNYGAGAIIGETPAVFGTYYISNTAFYFCDGISLVGTASGNVNLAISFPLTLAYIQPDGRAEQRWVLQPLFGADSTTPYGVCGYIDDYLLYPSTSGVVTEDIFGVSPQDAGTCTQGGNSNTSLRMFDTSKSWTINQWSSPTQYYLIIISGTGAGQIRAIADNGSNYIDVVTPFTTLPGNDSVYSICSEGWRYISASSLNLAYKETL